MKVKEMMTEREMMKTMRTNDGNHETDENDVVFVVAA